MFLPTLSPPSITTSTPPPRRRPGERRQFTLKLKRPFTYEGQTFDELNFDFEGLTGDDALAIEDELQAIGKPTISPTFSGQFLVRMAARACTNTIVDASGRPRRIGDDALRALPIFEFNRVRGKARSFLLASEL